MRVTGIPYVQGRNSYSDADGTKYSVAIHNTSNTATAEGEASYATRRTDGVSAHFYVDSDSIIQSLDTTARAGHAGSYNGNQNAVAVEITGLNSWTRQQWLDNVAWGLLGRVLAQVCQHYGIAVRRASVAEMQANPRVRAFYGHDDMRRAWGGTDHTDPGPSFPWDRLFAAVNAALGNDMEDDMTPEELLNYEITGPDGPLSVAVRVIWAQIHAAAAHQAAEQTLTAVTALRAVVDQLAAVIVANGGSVDTVAILAGVDERLARLAAEQRDAVADLGEGGAAQVRADA